uniref:Uncharacterized protein n=1 Tax=Panagrolaimus davidi TaxID=227884 RepID=A0A914PBJ2_9BILA
MGALLKNLRDLLVYFDGLTNVHQFQQYHANVQGFIHRIDGLLSVSPISRPRDVARLADRLDYEVRKMFSLRNPLLLICITHDAMSKNKSRLPHLNTNRSKVLSDCDLAYCTLSGLIVHRSSKL